MPGADDDAVSTGETLSLKDGTVVEIWETADNTRYQLPDGSVILEIDKPAFYAELPEDRPYPGSLLPGADHGFDELTEDVQTAIRDYCLALPPRYDLATQLERARHNYEKYGQDSVYHPFHMMWRYYPCAEGDNVLYVMTETEGLKDEWSTDSEFITTAFDKTTGEVIPPEDLFACSPEELAEFMVRRSGLSLEDKMQEMIEKFDLQYLVIFPGQVHLWYPEDTLTDQPPAKYWLTFDNCEDLLTLFHPWSRPYETQ